MAAILASTACVLAVASPATAAPALAIHSYQASRACLEQYFNGNQATTQVMVAPPCTYSNARWRFEGVGGNTYRVVNNRWDDSGLWCLSAPNGVDSFVFAELCVSPLPDKQKWTPIRARDANQLVNELSRQCLTYYYTSSAIVETCRTPTDYGYEAQEWYWH
ncbi:RICIN domain-containing protein [Cryptosporangium aurantiacum]|uniref:RICIN domain-containing protein n=1 Tax=Cryptosporangium aurantiacum TaxID=134849 RepID=UPI0011610AEF|nr:RICIN domain-containing protein [Cryptosporangium aurantiacum]